MDELFFKVYKNLFLRNKIFYHISNDKLNYDELTQYNHLNRIKFKHISSLKFMVEKNQFPLLNYKLKSGEFVQINRDGIELLFKKLSIKQQQSQQQSQEEESLLLLFNLKREILFKISNLLELSIKFNNLNFIKYLFKTQKSDKENEINKELDIYYKKFEIDSTTIEYALSNSSSIEVMEYLYNEIIINSSSKLLKEKIENKSLKLSTINGSIDIIQWVLNKGLYNEINFKEMEKIHLNHLLNIKSNLTISIKLLEMNLLDRENDNETNICSIVVDKIIKTLKDKSIQELIYYNLLLNNKIDGGSGSSSSENGDNEDYKKKLKFLILKSPMSSIDKELLYFEYLVDYDDVIVDLPLLDSVVYEYTFSLLSMNALKYLTSKSLSRQSKISPEWSTTLKEKYLNNYYTYKDKLFDGSKESENRIIEFINQYCQYRSQENLKKDTGLQFLFWPTFANCLLYYMEFSVDLVEKVTNIKGFPYRESFINIDFPVGEISPMKKYQWYYENIILHNYRDNQIEYYGLNQYLSTIQCKQDIDFIFKIRNPSIKLEIQFLPISMNLLENGDDNDGDDNNNSISISNYFKSLFKHIPDNYCYSIPFLKSLLTFNLKILKELDLKIGVVFKNFGPREILAKTDYKKEFFNEITNQIEKDEIIEFFNYLNQSNYRIFDCKTWILYISSLFKSLHVSLEGENKIQLLKQLNINYNQFQNESIMLVINFIFESKFEEALIILSSLNFYNNNIDSIKLNDINGFVYQTQQYCFYKVAEDDGFRKKIYKNKFQFQLVFKVLELILKNWNFKKGGSGDGSDDYYNDILVPLFEHLYRTILQCFDSNFYNIKLVRDSLLSIGNYKVSEDLFETFNYLTIKSIKISSFIISKERFNYLIKKKDKDSSRLLQDPFLSQCLMKPEFSFDSIFNSTETQLLLKLQSLFQENQNENENENENNNLQPRLFTHQHIRIDVFSDYEKDVYFFGNIGEIEPLFKCFKGFLKQQLQQDQNQDQPHNDDNNNNNNNNNTSNILLQVLSKIFGNFKDKQLLNRFINEFCISNNDNNNNNCLDINLVFKSAIQVLRIDLLDWMLNDCKLKDKIIIDSSLQSIHSLVELNHIEFFTFFINNCKASIKINDVKKWYSLSQSLGYQDLSNLFINNFPMVQTII
ncbi:hypothetical protein ACTFIR_007196 [Dictyostelium discoideum]